MCVKALPVYFSIRCKWFISRVLLSVIWWVFWFICQIIWGTKTFFSVSAVVMEGRNYHIISVLFPHWLREFWRDGVAPTIKDMLIPLRLVVTLRAAWRAFHFTSRFVKNSPKTGLVWAREGGVHSLNHHVTRNGFNILSCEFCEQHIVETSLLSAPTFSPLLSPTHFLWPPLLQHPGAPFLRLFSLFLTAVWSSPPPLRPHTTSNKRCRRPVCFYRVGGGGHFARHALNVGARRFMHWWKLQISWF